MDDQPYRLPNPNDLAAIELQARKLRAEAVRHAFAALGRAIARALSHRPARTGDSRA
ncbi:MAG: hypothetical protein AAGE18_18375 [Pseudomonadota bacterium]